MYTFRYILDNFASMRKSKVTIQIKVTLFQIGTMFLLCIIYALHFKYQLLSNFKLLDI